MILVDSSAWIAFFSPRSSRAKDLLDALLDEPWQLATTGLVLCEVLQGTRDDRARRIIESTLLALDLLPEPRVATYLAAARLYRSARVRGFTVRGTIDCVLAAQCIESGVAVFHVDRDFDTLARVSSLKVHPI